MQCMRRGNRSVRTSVYSLFRRTRAAQNVAHEGIRTRGFEPSTSRMPGPYWGQLVVNWYGRPGSVLGSIQEAFTERRHLILVFFVSTVVSSPHSLTVHLVPGPYWGQLVVSFYGLPGSVCGSIHCNSRAIAHVLCRSLGLYS